MDFLFEPWPWYVSGPVIGISIPLLLILGNKSLGISSSLRHVCAATVPGKVSFLNYNWKAESWNLFFALGILLGGFLGGVLLNNGEPVKISEQTNEMLLSYGISNFNGLIPQEIFSWESLLSLKGFLIIVVGGFLIGFGSRYAGGCTSGHAIMGLSTLQWPSLVAVISFFVGGLVTAHFIVPFIFSNL
jgi:uncharacterized protein